VDAGAPLNEGAPKRILGAHELERRPIPEQVSRFAMRRAEGAIRKRSYVPLQFEQITSEGGAVRTRVGEDALRLLPIDNYTPYSVPGFPLPRVWLRHGRTHFDAFARDHTSLRFGPPPDGKHFEIPP
jgi:hypothetical protein